MPDTETDQKVSRLEQQIADLRRQVHAARREAPPQPVADYVLQCGAGPVHLADQFGDKDDLFVIHNMGRSCPNCTLWADGYNGLVPHLQSRAAFVVSSPDDPATQAAFAASRGWRFRMVSHAGTSFAADMGYRSERGYRPGVSVFQRRPDGIVRVNHTDFGPHDEYCAAWPLLDLLPGGAGDWRPKFSYV